MRFAIVGAGGMGCLYGGRLAEAGHEVVLLDGWEAHVAALARDGLALEGIGGARRIAVAAHPFEFQGTLAPVDVALIQTDTNGTAAAAGVAARLLAPQGCALTLQNGVGNLEALAETLGAGRVLGGLSYHSAELPGPGSARHTHAGPTWLGETDGRRSERLAGIAAAFAEAGLDPRPVDDIVGLIWEKFVHNSAINAICAIAGLRVGELSRMPEADALQSEVIAETLAVLAAKGIRLPNGDPTQAIKDFCKLKFNRPSMLQHMEAGRPIEVDALNGVTVREGARLGVPTPYNQAVVWLAKARARHMAEKLYGPPVDWAALEREAQASWGAAKP